MLNFTVGPVQMNDKVREIGSQQVPYFRTAEFSKIVLESEMLLKKLSKAEDSSRVIFVTGSGTAAMEASIMNVFNQEDKLLIVNGGSFGQRFVNLCKIYELHFTEIKLELGEDISEERLNQYRGNGYTGFIINAHETSTGVYYNMKLISEFCKENSLLLMVDAISSFLADPLSIRDMNIDVMITGSQKALACPPGISIIILSENAINRIRSANIRSMYFDLKQALQDGRRGQTPFTPAVGIIIQVNGRLKQIEQLGGAEKEIEKVKKLAMDFRYKIQNLPFSIPSMSLSNAITPLHPFNIAAYKVFEILKDKYDIWVCPNGGELSEKIFRVGHIGDLSLEDNDILINALKELQERKVI